MRRLGLLVLLLVTGCRVDAALDVVVDEDGSGQVIVTVTLDAAAAARIPDLADQLQTDDLVATGWTVEEPAPTDDGGVVVIARKDFFAPEEAAAVVAEVTGPDGLVTDVALDRARPFARREFAFDATLDLSQGIEAFGDAELAEILDGLPVGVDVAALEEELGTPVDEATSFRLRVHLPGGTTFNEDAAVVEEVDDRQVFAWEARLGDEARPVSARTRDLDVPAVALAGVAVVGVVAVVGLAVAARRRPS